MAGLDDLLKNSSRREIFNHSVRALAFNHKKLFGMENFLISRVIQITEIVIVEQVKRVYKNRELEDLWKQFFFVLHSKFERL